MLLHRFEECGALGFNVICESNPATVVRDQLPKYSLASLEGKLHQVVPVDVQDIERIKINRDLPVGFSDILRAREMDSRLKQTEMRLPFFIESRDFSVEDC